MISIYDMDLVKTAVLENAYQIQETQELNNIYTLSFRIPENDAKLQYCQGFHYVRNDDGELYRIVKTELDDNDTGTVMVSCEHVIATLCDDIMFGSFIYGGDNVHTREVIEWILEQQKTPHWTLGECDFDMEFEYGWEQENLLNALYSIPKQFVTPYRWTFDTSGFPWTVSLKAIDETAKPEYFIRANINLLSSKKSSNFADVCTRLYPLGYGEGINQLTIRSVNNNVPYLEASQEMIAQYGIKEKVLVDRSFENAESLKAFAETAFAALQVPAASRSFDVVDLYPITSEDIDNAEVGKICRMTEDGTKAYITKTTRILDEPGNLQIEISTKTDSVVNTIADLADRVRIESVYAQGATQIYQHSKDANAGTTVAQGHVISLYFPSEMKQINKVMLRLQLKRFRSYSATTDNSPSSAQTSSGGGAYASTDACQNTGGNVSYSIDTVWSGDGNAIYLNEATLPTGGPDKSEFSGHAHTAHGSIFAIKNNLAHTHTMTAYGSQSHQHMITLPNHDHTVTIPGHSHNIIPGIYESTTSPSSFSIYVGSTLKTTISGTSYNGDITQWLLNNQNMIPRNTWITVTIVPNALAYVVSSVFVQGFVQSRGGGNY